MYSLMPHGSPVRLPKKAPSLRKLRMSSTRMAQIPSPTMRMEKSSDHITPPLSRMNSGSRSGSMIERTVPYHTKYEQVRMPLGFFFNFHASVKRIAQPMRFATLS